MVKEKLFQYNRRIFIYSFAFVFLAALSLVFGLTQNFTSSAFGVPVNNVIHRIDVEGGSFHIESRFNLISRDKQDDRLFIYPLILPEKAELISYRVKYPFKTKGEVLKNGSLTWKGNTPQKQQKATLIIEYNYRVNIPEIRLPVKDMGLLSPTDDCSMTIDISVDSRLRSFESNYTLKTRVKNFSTRLSSNLYLGGNKEDFLIKW